MFNARSILRSFSAVAALSVLALAGACSDAAPEAPAPAGVASVPGVQEGQARAPVGTPATQTAAIPASFHCDYDSPERPRGAAPEIAARDPLYRASAAEKAASKPASEPAPGEAQPLIGTVTADTLARQAELRQEEEALSRTHAGAPADLAALVAKKKEDIFRR